MGAKPGLPPQRHSVQRIAHACVKQIAKQKLGTHRRVDEVDQRIKAKTLFVKSLIVNAEQLMSTAKNSELKTLTKKVYEAIRYSDPMSDAGLVDIENKIQKQFEEFRGAIMSEDAELSAELANEVIVLIDSRNKKCKLLK